MTLPLTIRRDKGCKLRLKLI